MRTWSMIQNSGRRRDANSKFHRGKTCAYVSPNDERPLVSSCGPHVQALDSVTRLWCGRRDQYIATHHISHACMQLHATPTVIFIGIGVGRPEIPIKTWSRSRQFKFSTREKISRKLSSLFKSIAIFCWGKFYCTMYSALWQEGC